MSGLQGFSGYPGKIRQYVKKTTLEDNYHRMSEFKKR